MLLNKITADKFLYPTANFVKQKITNYMKDAKDQIGKDMHLPI